MRVCRLLSGRLDIVPYCNRSGGPCHFDDRGAGAGVDAVYGVEELGIGLAIPEDGGDGEISLCSGGECGNCMIFDAAAGSGAFIEAFYASSGHGGALKLDFDGIGHAGIEGSFIGCPDEIPEIVVIDRFTPAVEDIGPEEHLRIFDKFFLIKRAGVIQFVSRAVGGDDLDPGFDHVEGAGGEFVAGFIVGEDDLEGDFGSDKGLLGGVDEHGDDGTGGPLVGDFGDFNFAAEPLFDEPGLFL